MTEQEFFEKYTPGYDSLDEAAEVICDEIYTIDNLKEYLKTEFPDVEWTF